VLCLAFPLHPPGRPEKSRVAELDLPAAAGLPTLVLQGTRDAFGGPIDIPAAPGRLVVPIVGGDHSLRRAEAAGGSPLAQVVEVTMQWARQVAAG
jgi:predicted alpha/beta-hydrolase family hydrolase